MALAAAFEFTHGFAPPDFGLPYFMAGGRLGRVPAFIEAVIESGYSGLAPLHFMAPCSLRWVASSLRPRVSEGSVTA